VIPEYTVYPCEFSCLRHRRHPRLAVDFYRHLTVLFQLIYLTKLINSKRSLWISGGKPEKIAGLPFAGRKKSAGVGFKASNIGAGRK